MEKEEEKNHRKANISFLKWIFLPAIFHFCCLCSYSYIFSHFKFDEIQFISCSFKCDIFSDFFFGGKLLSVNFRWIQISSNYLICPNLGGESEAVLKAVIDFGIGGFRHKNVQVPSLWLMYTCYKAVGFKIFVGTQSANDFFG